MRLRTITLCLAGLCACTGSIDGGGDDTAGDDDAPMIDGGGGPGSPDASVGSGMYAMEASFCVDETNRYRAMHGKPALVRSQALEEYAMEGAEYDYHAPINPPHPHFQMTGGGGIAFAENECPHQLGWNLMGTVRQTVAACVKAFYDEGPGGGHYENMMGNYGSLGCGIYVEGNGITIVQDFGQ